MAKFASNDRPSRLVFLAAMGLAVATFVVKFVTDLATGREVSVAAER